MLSFPRPKTTAIAPLALLCALTLLAPGRPAHAGLTFQFTEGAALQASANHDNVINGFNQAATLWSNLFTDNITVNIAIDYQSLGAGILGQAGSNTQTYSYSQVRSALNTDAYSTQDASAVGTLPTGSALSFLINHTSDNPNGANSATPYLDSSGGPNNTTLSLNTANAKSLGLLAANAAGMDADISFSSDFGFDFDRSNGISAGQYDFVGIAAHEIGHALGFVSGVDDLDYGPNAAADSYRATTLDLFRFSAQSVALGSGVLDFTADNRAKFFSIDGGLTSFSANSIFSNGVNFGDGRQASHWKDSIGAGVLDPTAGQGEFLNISENDIRAFDVIGYNVATPEPSTLLLAIPCLLGSSGIFFWRRRFPAGIPSKLRE